MLLGLSLIGCDELASRNLPAAAAHDILIRHAIMDVKLDVFIVCYVKKKNKEVSLFQKC